MAAMSGESVELDMQLFEEWIIEYEKKYSSEDERDKRFKVFQQCVRRKEAEKERPKFSLTLNDILNPFFDLTIDEFMREFMGYADGADHEISDEDDEDLRCGYRIVIDRTVKSDVPVLIYTRIGNDVSLRKVVKPKKKCCDDVPKQAVKPQKPCCEDDDDDDDEDDDDDDDDNDDDDDDDVVVDDDDEEAVKPQKTCCCDDDDADHDDPDEEAVKPQKTCCDDDDPDEEAVKRQRAGNDDDDVPKQAVKQQKTGCDEKDTKGPMEAPEEEP